MISKSFDLPDSCKHSVSGVCCHSRCDIMQQGFPLIVGGGQSVLRRLLAGCNERLDSITAFSQDWLRYSPVLYINLGNHLKKSDSSSGLNTRFYGEEALTGSDINMVQRPRTVPLSSKFPEPQRPLWPSREHLCCLISYDLLSLGSVMEHDGVWFIN